MRSTFSILFYINRNKVKADGTTAVMCRISIDGKISVLSTGVNCNPEHWKLESKNNKELLKLRTTIEQTYDKILKDTGVVSAELLKNTIVGVNAVPTTLLQAGEVERERLRLRSIEIKSTSSHRQSKTTQLNLSDYIQSRGLIDIPFADITEEFGESFKVFLKRERDYSASHINHCLCWLNRLIYIAVDQEIIRYNPLEEVKYEKKKAPQIRHITRNQLKQLMQTPMQDKMMELARRMFIFSSFCGLAYVDILRLYPHHIGKASDGRLYIRQKRGKTKVEAFVPLHPIAERILMMYNTTDETNPVFPLPNRDLLWRDINAIGIAFGFKQNLSHHQSRHTFGTLLLSEGISIESIAKMMGHTNISSTQVYAKVTDDKISEDMDKLIQRRKTMKNDVNNTTQL